jgi:hypothetical protein
MERHRNFTDGAVRVDEDAREQTATASFHRHIVDANVSVIGVDEFAVLGDDKRGHFRAVLHGPNFNHAFLGRVQHQKECRSGPEPRL